MKARKVDKAVSIVQDHEEDVEMEVKETVLNTARSLYLAKLQVKYVFAYLIFP